MRDKRYFNFLQSLVDGSNHQYLLKKLHNIDYYSIIPNDDNRGKDGKRLREMYTDKCRKEGQHGLSSFPCSVLEMLIGLSYRMEYILDGSIDAFRDYSEYFWLFLENLALKWLNDEVYLDEDGDDIVDDVIENVLEREYTSKGLGGIFPLKKTEKDQREIEIWYQMSEYILENFRF